jgi:AraC-like DNA-binding protein
MIAALRAFPSVALPDPTLTPCERIILDMHPVERMIRVTDMENECEHGNLPFDHQPDCECWTRERTAALLGQAPLDDGCPGLDRAAALDLHVPQIALCDPQIEVPRQAPTSTTVSSSSRPQEVQMESTTNGSALVMHDWYMADDARTMADVARQFGLSVATTKRRFEDAELPCKPRGGRRTLAVTPTVEVEAKVAETPIAEIAPAVVALERELLALNLRRSKVEGAIEVLRELAA